MNSSLVDYLSKSSENFSRAARYASRVVKNFWLLHTSSITLSNFDLHSLSGDGEWLCCWVIVASFKSTSTTTRVLQQIPLAYLQRKYLFLFSFFVLFSEYTNPSSSKKFAEFSIWCNYEVIILNYLTSLHSTYLVHLAVYLQLFFSELSSPVFWKQRHFPAFLCHFSSKLSNALVVYHCWLAFPNQLVVR